jgi:hypothetical protein
MNGSRLILFAVIASTAIAATGCDGAFSASTTSVGNPAARDAESVAQPDDGPAPSESSDSSASATLPRDAAGVVEATFDDVKFPMEKTDAFVESMLTTRVKSLFGQKIRIRGYMYPTLRKRGLKQFVLVRDNMECCFGPGAALFDCVLVSMVGDVTAEYSIRPVAVEGEFRFEPLAGPDGRPLAIYQMACDVVKSGG